MTQNDENQQRRANQVPQAQAGRQPETTASRTTIAAEWSGPLPPPSALEQFNAVVPNGAERVFKMAELEQAHRIEMERIGQEGSIKDTRRGQCLGATIAIAAMTGAVVAAALGAHWSVSVALVGVPIMGVVKAIVDRRSH